MRFEKIWIEQCRATRGIKRHFGAKSALDYLVGYVASRKPAMRKLLRTLLYVS